MSPAEIEEVIYTHPAVKTVCVVGIADDSAGEVPLACVIVKEGHNVTEQEIVKLVEGTKCLTFRFVPFLSFIGTTHTASAMLIVKLVEGLQCKMFIFGQKFRYFWEILIFSQ